ncbi:MAG: MerR family DNA-binding transcriptional regulator [Gammaproteobacteria bacterium]|nr:MerR family DNA-binding transcriptional regulator [Gammaproteobacteria bacterium]
MPVITYTISELSKEFDITTRSIRFYEDQGLLTPQRNGLKRIYTTHDRTWLKLILRGKRLGLTLAEISQILELYDPHATNNDQQLLVFIEKIKTRKTALQQQMEDIRALQDELNAAEERCNKALSNHPTLENQS